MTEPVNFCPGCGAKRREGAVFCSECGASFEEGKPSEAAVSQSAANYTNVPRTEPPQSFIQALLPPPRQFASGASISIPNPQRTVARIWFLIGFLTLALTQLPSTIAMDMMNGGYALIFFAGFFTFISFLTALVYGGRAREFDKISRAGRCWRTGITARRNSSSLQVRSMHGI